MPNWSEPYNPVGRYDPAFMTNLYGASWDSAWNTCIYGSPMQASANVLSNCTGYAQGRMLRIYMEITGYNPRETRTHPFISFNLDAGVWLDIARSLGYTIYQEPQPGYIFVTGSHVGVIEKYENGEWYVSESGYGNVNPYTYGPGIYQSGGKWYAMHASIPAIDGFFKIPETSPGPGPGPKPKKKKWIYYLKNWNNEI